MKKSILAFCAFSFLAPATISAHCQIPCGIYNDDNVIESMHTDFETIEKASQQIIELSKDPSKNAHQLTRWITNKESHAQAIQEKVLNYFLAQRLKLAEAESDKATYMAKLQLCHQVIVTAMKCKQSTDATNVAKLHDLMHSFEQHFGTPKEKK
ncbi:MAG: superoxide dismutase [Ni] [Akkermansiaceae bacterium]